MNRRQLIRAVAAHTANDVKHVESVIAGATDVITAVVAKGEAVTIQGFAKFAKVERAARMGRNPRTGEQIRIRASRRVKVSPMKAFKDTAMAPSTAPRLSSGVYPTSADLLAKQAAARKGAAAPKKASAPAAAKMKAPAPAAAKKKASAPTAAKKKASAPAAAKMKAVAKKHR